MKITAIATATTDHQLDAMGKLFIDNTDSGIRSLSDAFYNVYDNVIIEAAILNRVDLDDGQYWYVLGITDKDGVTYTADNARASTPQPPNDVIASPFADLLEKGNRYNQLLSALGTHKLRIFPTDMRDSLDTESELLAILAALNQD